MAKGPTNGLDFKKLCDTFSVICPDFRPGGSSEKLQSVDFANKVLFELGPKMRHVKQSGEDQMWRLVFSGGSSVYVHTYTFLRPIKSQPQLRDGKLYLTMKQAGLLAATQLCALMPAQHNPRDKILLTPLSRAVFEPQSIPKIAAALSALRRRVVDVAYVVAAVVSSCQSDGFHLQHSQCAIALVAIGATTKDPKARKRMRSKTLKQYSHRGKAFHSDEYKIYAEHSKMARQLAAESPISPIPPFPDVAKPPRRRDVAVVLRSIAKSPNDPLSGDTIDIKFVASAKEQDEDVVAGMSASVDVRLEGISMERMRFKLLSAEK
ncbi:uncharacterized protein DMAD_06468 [Drosophila madeirensis]|uniref:Uncharacterized protein n=1 Tax=Drosophila madeirensis TaxID=30013 RepID=A0AAU9FQK8_DROMD